MADLRVRAPGHPPWVPKPDPWWAWAARIVLAAAILCLVLGAPAQLLWA